MLKVISASAGSGKTYTLTKIYLSLILKEDNPLYFKRILAITFTNDAAAEMKKRVINTIQLLSENPETDMGLALCEELDILPTLLQNRAKKVLQQMIYRYSDIQIRTIDSFSHELSQVFALDLGIPFNFKVTFEEEEYVQLSVLQILEKVGTAEGHFLTSALEERARDLLSEGKSWRNRIVNDLSDLLKSAIHVNNKEFTLLNKPLEIKHFKEIKSRIGKHKFQLKNEIEKESQDALNVINTLGLQASDFKGGSKSFVSSLEKYAQNGDELFTKNLSKIFLNTILKNEWATESNSQDPIILNAANKVGPILEKIHKLYLEQRGTWFIYDYLYSDLNQLALVNNLVNTYEELVFEKDESSLNIIQDKIAQIIAKEPMPYIYERLGEKYNHVLIDEFQDTSVKQYFNLLPLVVNGLAEGHLQLLVGDPKQSIYAFRGGKVELMVYLLNDPEKILDSFTIDSFSIENHLATLNHLQKEVLPKNFRSYRNIVAFNNFLFQKIQTEPSSFQAQVFQDVVQEAQTTKPGGHVEILVFRDDKEKTETLSRLIEKIHENYKLGYSREDMAILCRKKDEAAEIAEFLKNNKEAVTSSDSLLLSKNAGVQLLSHSFQAYLQPWNIPAMQKAIWWYAKIHQLETPIPILDGEELFWQTIQAENLKNLTLYQSVEVLADKLGLLNHQEHQHYIFAYLDKVLVFSKQEGNDGLAWIAYWDKIKDKTSLNKVSQKAILVTTIHKAKGLEFPIVFVPFLNWQPKSFSNDGHWFAIPKKDLPLLKTMEGMALPAARIPISSKLENTVLENQYKEFLKQNQLESINTLYVALTRPIKKLYLFTDGKGVGKDVINAFNVQDSSILYQDDSANEKTSIPEIKTEKLVFKTSQGRMKIKQMSKYAHLWKEGTPIYFGNLVHMVLARTATLGDLSIVLKSMQKEGILENKEREHLEVVLSNLFANSKVAALFASDQKILTERQILTPSGEIYRPDRILLRKQETVVVDFKTGKEDESHKTQLEKYGKLLETMGFPSIKKVLLYIDPIKYVEL